MPSSPATSPAPVVPPAPPGDGEGGRWPPWSAPLALVMGLFLALVGELVVQIPASAANASFNHPPHGVVLIDTVVQDFCFVAAAVFLAWQWDPPPRPWQFGLRPTPVRAAALLVVGLIGGFLLFTWGWTSLLNLGGDTKVLDQLGSDNNEVLLIGSAALTCVLAPACEEFLFRGYMFPALSRWQGPWVAALITGLLFGIVHVASAPIGYLAPLALLGFALCLLRWRTGSVYPCIVAHSINNSLAFGSDEHWGWQIPVLLVASLAVLTLFGVVLSRRGFGAAVASV
jgi:membrane protease YdiL (CAAX protease family)